MENETNGGGFRRDKMREALEYVIQWCENCISEEGADNVDDMIAVVNAALAEPERNCDLKECSTDDGMIAAHERFCKSWHDDGNYCSDCPYNPKSPMMTCRERWLLAPAHAASEEIDMQISR